MRIQNSNTSHGYQVLNNNIIQETVMNQRYPEMIQGNSKQLITVDSSKKLGLKRNLMRPPLATEKHH